MTPISPHRRILALFVCLMCWVQGVEEPSNYGQTLHANQVARQVDSPQHGRRFMSASAEFMLSMAS